MSLSLGLFHLNSVNGTQKPILPNGYWSMVTCLRSIVISEHSRPVKALESYEFYQGREAYGFLLEVICGLHSPMLGETEILGQFKDFVSKNKYEFNSEMLSIVDHLLQEAKKIRKEYLQNLGCTSYGSLLRKHLRSQDQNVHIIGAGSLSQDILPWFSKLNRVVQVYTRDTQNHQSLMKKHKNLSLKTLDYLLKTLDCLEQTGIENTLDGKGSSSLDSRSLKPMGILGVLVVAAPVTSHWFNENINPRAFEEIYDLRGESRMDPLRFPNVISLQALFSDIQKNRDQALLIKKKVLQSIKDRTLRVHPMEKQRPFGWEDLWIHPHP